MSPAGLAWWEASGCSVAVAAVWIARVARVRFASFMAGETQNPEGKGRKRQPASDIAPMPEPMEVEIVPGFKVKVLGTTGEQNKRRRRRRK